MPSNAMYEARTRCGNHGRIYRKKGSNLDTLSDSAKEGLGKAGQYGRNELYTVYPGIYSQTLERIGATWQPETCKYHDGVEDNGQTCRGPQNINEV